MRQHRVIRKRHPRGMESTYLLPTGRPTVAFPGTHDFAEPGNTRRMPGTSASPYAEVRMASSRSRTSFLAPMILGALALGCGDNKVVDPASRSINLEGSNIPAVKAGEANTDALAKGLAYALGDDATRTRVRDDLRDSPYRAHAIHLASYLRGTSGSAVAAKAAAGLGVGVAEFVKMAESTPNLELVMPRPLDRTTWEGGADIDVTASPITLKQRKEAKRVSERGYDVRGNAKEVVTLRYSPGAYMIVRPAELDYPADPEAVRAAAPRQDRNTVTTPAEEREVMLQRGIERAARENAAIATAGSIVRVGPATAMVMLPPPDGGGGSYTPPPPTVGGGGATLASYMTKSYCYGYAVPLDSYSDRDHDLVRDDCEAALAQRLAPLLNIGDWEFVPARQPYWSLSRHPLRPDNIQIIYALSYLEDDGYLIWGGGHSGDSEFIILEVKNTSGSNWGTILATLSAHFGAEEGVAPQYQPGADSYYWDDLDYPQGPFPRIWSALGKHANYRNRAACEAGAWLQDSCGGPYIGTQIYAPASHNLGNYYHQPIGNRMTSSQLVDCTQREGPTWDAKYLDRSGTECFWLLTNDRFSGWNPIKPDAVTPYRRIFQIFGF